MVVAIVVVATLEVCLVIALLALVGGVNRSRSGRLQAVRRREERKTVRIIEICLPSSPTLSLVDCQVGPIR
jgi:hypothetical protein